MFLECSTKLRQAIGRVGEEPERTPGCTANRKLWKPSGGTLSGSSFRQEWEGTNGPALEMGQESAGDRAVSNNGRGTQAPRPSGAWSTYGGELE